MLNSKNSLNLFERHFNVLILGSSVSVPVSNKAELNIAFHRCSSLTALTVGRVGREERPTSAGL